MMKDSKLSPQWLQDTWAKYPCVELMNDAGQPTGNVRTGPVRLSFANIFEKGKPSTSGGEGKFGSILLFPPFADLTPLTKIAMQKVAEGFPNVPRDQNGYPIGIGMPFRRQEEKAHKYAGFTPGSWFVTATSRYKPQVVDSAGNPIVDPARIYAGVWAIVVCNAYVYGVSPPQPKKGVSMGIQTLMIVADDNSLGGGGMDPQKAFSGIQLTQDMNVNALMPTTAGVPMPGIGAAANMPVHALPPATPMMVPGAPPPMGDPELSNDDLV